MAVGLILIGYLSWGLFGPLLSQQARLRGALIRFEVPAAERTDSAISPR